MELIRGAVPAWALSGYGYGYGYWFLIGQKYVPTKADDSVLAFWRSDANGKPANGGRSEAVSVGMKQKISGRLTICSNGLHATMDPGKWKGERLWVVALHGEVQHQDDKFAALEREIIAEIPL